MGFSAPDPVVSGRAHHVVSVNGSLPSSLQEFVGEASFVVLSLGAGSLQIRGEGTGHGEGVRFQEKDLDNAGKDVRTWQVEAIDADFTATPTAAF